jgi:hypothetical protein
VNRSWNGFDHYYGPGPVRPWDSGNRPNISGNTIDVIDSGDRISATSVQSELQQRVGSTDVSATRVVGRTPQPSPARLPVSAVPGEAVAPAVASGTSRSVNAGSLGSGRLGQVSSARGFRNAYPDRIKPVPPGAAPARPTAATRRPAGFETTDRTRTTGSVFSGADFGEREGLAGARGAESRLGSRFGGRFRG